MIYIFFNDGVQPATCVHRCGTIEEAKKWLSDQLKGFTMVDDDHPCTEDVMTSSKTALYQVFNGYPITIGEDGGPCLKEPIFETDYFYTE